MSGLPPFAYPLLRHVDSLLFEECRGSGLWHFAVHLQACAEPNPILSVDHVWQASSACDWRHISARHARAWNTTRARLLQWCLSWEVYDPPKESRKTSRARDHNIQQAKDEIRLNQGQKKYPKELLRQRFRRTFGWTFWCNLLQNPRFIG